jgi:very-short-patch-repair endonuclease/predicted transcriptional regulator of viral defense system
VLPCDAARGTLGDMADETSNRWKERHPCITAKAGRQWGNVTTAQLFACGVTGPVISRWVTEGRLDRVLRGVYSVGHRSPAPEAFWAAVLLGYGDGSVLTRHTSLALHGLGRPPRKVTVAVPKQARKQRGVQPHSSMPFERDEVVIRRGLRTTSIERTLLDLAAIGEPIERLVAEATAKRLTSIAKLRTYLARRSGARGAAGLRRCIEGRQTRSEAETEFVRWLEDRRIPVPDLNVPFGPFTLDALWPATGLVVEIDTYGTHGTWQSFEDDRRRDAYTAARGLRTIRVTPTRWRHDADTLERDIRLALAHS